MIDLERESLSVDRAAARAALSALAPLLDRLPDYPPPSELAARLPATTGELAAEAIDEWDDGDGAVNFVQALLIARALEGQLTAATIAGRFEVETDEAQAAIRHGSLRVEGDLDLHANLIVLGDLDVAGRVRDAVKWTRLIVTGDLRSRTIWSGGPLWVGGTISSTAIICDYHSKIWSGADVVAELVVGSPEARPLSGNLRVEHQVPTELWERDRTAAMARLEELLVPEAFSPADDGRHYAAEPLLRRVEAGLPFLRER